MHAAGLGYPNSPNEPCVVVWTTAKPASVKIPSGKDATNEHTWFRPLWLVRIVKISSCVAVLTMLRSRSLLNAPRVGFPASEDEFENGLIYCVSEANLSSLDSHGAEIRC